MRTIFLAGALVVIFPAAALAQQTTCTRSGGAVTCMGPPSLPAQSPYLAQSIQQMQATPAPTYATTNQAYYEAGTMAGTALGAGLSRLFGRQPAPAAPASEAQAQAEIDAFAATHPDLPTYRKRMGELIGAGRASNLQDAYILARYGG